MISIEEAFQLVEEHATAIQSSVVSVDQALHCYLAVDVFSSINMPPFRQSAMDGYAVHIGHENTYQLVGEVQAGDGENPSLAPGETVRIFTGAPVPDTANAVVMQEKVSANGESVHIEDPILEGVNIRPMGEQVRAGETALKKGTKLTPAAIGYLTSLGITAVEVFDRPSVGIVTTGDELVTAGQPLSYGKIYESNTLMIQSALRSLNYDDLTTYSVKDDYQATYDILGKAISENDMVLITGGISVGDYDFVGKALQEQRVDQIFYKVKQKPGKPLFFGKKEDKLIFALPGNPAAALSCFYTYVYMALEKRSGASEFLLPKTMAKSCSSFSKKGDRPQFLKAILALGEVTILEGQNSSMLQTFALANVLVFVPGDIQTIEPGDMLETIHLPKI